MNFLKSLFSKKGNNTNPIKTYGDFWNWFSVNEQEFRAAVKNREHIERDFLDKISPKLRELKEGFYFLAGMYDDSTAELIITADGNLKNIVFVEELMAAAPAIDGWKFTAHKQAVDMEKAHIDMGGLKFSSDKLNFYPNEHEGYPDVVDITVVYEDFTEQEKQKITNGVYIFIDNCLGELESVTAIDSLSVTGKESAQKELIPILKLKDYLIWRQKEFIEKYEGVRHNTETDNYGALEGTLQNGMPLIAIINSDLLDWESKASHPWIVEIEIKYDGLANNGMPDSQTLATMNAIEDSLMKVLKDGDGYLNIGRQTGGNERSIYFACKDFREPSKVLYQIKKEYAGKLSVDYSIYKDKYWQSFDRFTRPR